jgi:preprotein translocase subunit SecE
MASQAVETVEPSGDKLRWVVAIALVIAGIVAFYMLKQAQWVRVGALFAGLIAGAAVFFTSFAGKELIGFGREAYREVRKVVWPTRKETLQTTAFVFVFVVIMAAVLWIVDLGLEWVIYDLILGYKK